MYKRQPITVGGGIRSIDDVKYLLRCGAEKVAINTAATKNPELIKEVSRKFGSQCMVLSIEAKRAVIVGKSIQKTADKKQDLMLWIG